jgi:hypothetical protein
VQRSDQSRIVEPTPDPRQRRRPDAELGRQRRRGCADLCQPAPALGVAERKCHRLGAAGESQFAIGDSGVLQRGEGIAAPDRTAQDPLGRFQQRLRLGPAMKAWRKCRLRPLFACACLCMPRASGGMNAWAGRGRGIDFLASSKA